MTKTQVDLKVYGGKDTPEAKIIAFTERGRKWVIHTVGGRSGHVPPWQVETYVKCAGESGLNVKRAEFPREYWEDVLDIYLYQRLLDIERRVDDCERRLKATEGDSL